jgi:hypothetical protein
LKLRHNIGWATSHVGKHTIVHHHFKATIRNREHSTLSFNWESLNRPSHNFAGLDDPFF